METKSDIRNELFKRNEISFGLNSEKTPSFEEMKKKISGQVKKPEENINVYNIKGNFGLKQFNISAYVYDSKEDLKKAEQKTQKQRTSEKENLKKGYEEAKKTKTEEPAKAEESSLEENSEES
jgi:ribosomal protein S24E